ncbi:hypothetical protein AB0L88_11620 [Saccharopolyspora shandongensis]|uniref:hypothetical protein n=1 Tax=Saccharopolyspora shandongensis TaxID=418495 RepID=UPI00343BB05D
MDNPEDRQRLIEEALAQGHKISPDKVAEIGKDPNGRIVWLEEGKGGKGGAGLEHVYEHEKEFTDRGIPREEIGKFAHEAATEGKYTGYSQGKPPGRPIFEIEYGGQRHFVALTIGSNGFIVGANMKSSKDPFENAWSPAEADNPTYRGW